MESKIASNVLANIDEWSNAVKAEDLQITRLSGMSNAVYKVEVRPSVAAKLNLKKVVYRQFEQDLTDATIERTVFRIMSDSSQGAQLFTQTHEYRIESFFGRPLSIWEMRNPLIYNKVASLLCDFHNMNLQVVLG